MKKILAILMACAMILGCACAVAETAVDAVTTASVANYYGALTGDELMDAINSYTGFYAVASVNPDGTPNIAYFIYGMKKLGDVYYVQLGINPNQTTANIDNGSALIAMYGALPAADAQLQSATSGAKMVLKKVEDEAVLAELLKTAPEGYTPMYYEVVETRPLG